MEDDYAAYAEYLQKHQDRLIAQWERAARDTLAAAAEAETLTLRDHLPSILRDLSKAFEWFEAGMDPREAGSRAFSPARSADHGRHRASTERYSIDQVIEEFILLRHILRDHLAQATALYPNTIEIVDRILELSLLESCKTFTEALQQLQRKLFGTLAHDLRTPIAIAFTSMDLLRNGQMDSAEAQAVWDTAQRALKRSLGMLRDLLDAVIVRGGEGILMKFELADYSTELAETCNGIKLIYGDRLQAHLPGHSVPAVFCRSSIRRLVENLVSNAEKHGSPGRPIIINCEDQAEDIEVSVHNEGRPIPEEDQRRIFGFLYRRADSAHAREDSWGMGLTLAKVVAEAHRGAVRIESAEGAGTCFIVRLAKRPRQPGDMRATLNLGEES